MFAFSRTLLLPLEQYIDINPNFDKVKGLITADEEILEMYYQATKTGQKKEMFSKSLKELGSISIAMNTKQGKFKLSLKIEPEELGGIVSLKETIEQGLVNTGLNKEEIRDILAWKEKVIKEIGTNKWIGEIPWANGKVSQILVENFMQELNRYGQKVFGENFKFESVNSTEAKIVNETGETFTLTYQDDGFHLDEIGEAKMKSFGQFNGDVQQRLEVFSKFIAFAYQQSFIEIPETSITLEMPGKRKLIELEQQGIIERFKDFPYNLDDLALVGNQREYLGNLAKQLREFFVGEGHKPSLALICGQSGTGKSTIAKALMNTAQNDIPCYILKNYRGNNWDSYLQKLKEFFFYLKVGKGLVFVEDLEKFLGRDPVKKMELEHLLNEATEEIATSPYSYLITVTEHPENIISKSLTAGGHRLEVIELEKISEPEDVKEMIMKILRMIDAGLNQRPQLSSKDIKAKYQVNYDEIADYINAQGGLVPGQIRRILMKCLKGTTVNTEEFKSEVENFIEQETRIDNQRSTARIEELEDMVLALQKKIEQFSPGVVPDVRDEGVEKVEARLEELEDRTKEIEDRRVGAKEEIMEIREKARETGVTELQARSIAIEEIKSMASRVLEFIDGKK